MTKRIAVVGAGKKARVRTKALLATKKAVICGIASRTLASAQKFGQEIGCHNCFDDFQALIATAPDAILAEVPHGAQNDIVLWALDQGLHVLIGGCLAASSGSAAQIARIASSKQLVVEAGYECRYSGLWQEVKRLITEREIGKLVAVRSLALYDANPQSWYYQEHTSGGMPLTHMTYCFINPIRWILGDPLCISAFSNRMRQTGPGTIREETCSANFLFHGDVVCNMTASFVNPGNVPGFSLLFLGTDGALDLFDDENTLTVYQRGRSETKDFSCESDALELQAEVFISAMDGFNECRNGPDDAAHDVRIAEAIVTSARQKKVVWI